MNNRVIEIRKNFGLTMEEFGQRLGVSRSAISNIESGKRNLTGQMVVSICREFGVDETWLRTGDGEMFSETDGSLSAELKDRFHLSDGAALLIEKFIKLKEEDREVVVNFLIGAAENLTSLEKRSLPPEEAYEKSLHDAQRTDSTASSTIDDTGKIAN